MAAWSGAGIAITLATANPAYRALALGAALLVVTRFAPSKTGLGVLFRTAGLASCAAVLLNLVLSHVGAHPFVHLPDALPGVGGEMTLESLAFGVSAGLGIAGCILFVAPLSLLLEPHQVLEALPRWLERTGIAVAVALALVPGIGRSFTAVREAQQMRGWRPRGLASWAEVRVPVMLTAAEDAIRLAEAMEARAFASGPRTSYGVPSWSPGDVVVVLGAVVAAASFIGERLVGLVPEWYPYPDLAPPEVAPLAAASCLLLVLPLAGWRSQP
jgi:energy-coupling factor transport system permease protein